MKRITCVFLIVLLPVLGQTASALESFDVSSFSTDLSIGYRSDELKWSVAGNRAGSNPNILSELSWEDVKSLELSAQNKLVFDRVPYLERQSQLLVDLSIGKILSGDVRDSDYAADNRSNEWSRSDNQADEGFLFALSGSWGPCFEIEPVRGLTITPLVGYAFDMQALSMTDGEQVVSEPSLKPARFSDPPSVGPIPQLDSDYTAYWYGPWIGGRADFQLGDKLDLSLNLQYHIVEFFAQADWNLRSEFEHPVSFEHEADGRGIVCNLKAGYQFSPVLSLLVNLNIQEWSTDAGSDRTYLADGTVSTSKLNEVEWSSFALTSGIRYLF